MGGFVRKICICICTCISISICICICILIYFLYLYLHFNFNWQLAITWSRVTGGLVRKMSKACLRWSPVNGMPDTLENWLRHWSFPSFWLWSYSLNSLEQFGICILVSRDIGKILLLFFLDSLEQNVANPQLARLPCRLSGIHFRALLSNKYYANVSNLGWLRIIGWKTHLERKDLLDPYEMGPRWCSIRASTYGKAETQGVSLDFHLEQLLIRTRLGG